MFLFTELWFENHFVVDLPETIRGGTYGRPSFPMVAKPSTRDAQQKLDTSFNVEMKFGPN